MIQAPQFAILAQAPIVQPIEQLQNLNWWHSLENDVHHAAKDVSHYAPIVTKIAAKVDPKQAKQIDAIGAGVAGGANMLKLQDLSWWNSVENDVHHAAAAVAKYDPAVTKAVASFDPSQAKDINAIGAGVEAGANMLKLQDLSWWNSFTNDVHSVAGDVAKYDPAVTKAIASVDPSQASDINAIGGGVEAAANMLKMQDLSWWNSVENDVHHAAAAVAKYDPTVTKAIASVDPSQASDINAIGGGVEAAANMLKMQQLNGWDTAAEFGGDLAAAALLGQQQQQLQNLNALESAGQGFLEGAAIAAIMA